MLEEQTMRIFKLQAEICQTMADPTRLAILHELRKGEISVGQIAAALNLPQSNVSRHLALLRERAIVLTRREGTTVYYSLASQKIAQACDLVREVLESRLIQNQALAGSLGTLRDESK